MKWSNKWKSSKKAKKQRMYRLAAPLHIKHKFLSAHLSAELRTRYGRRSLPLRKGDEVEIMVGNFAGHKGKIERIDTKAQKVYIEGVKVKKADGSEVLKAITPSNIKILSLNLSDKERAAIFTKSKKV
jgi:large subunit ribosomal protein L24